MPYIVLSDVKDAAPQLFTPSATSTPDSRINAAIALVDNQINAMLVGMGYTVPIDPSASPQSFAIVKDLETLGVVARLIQARTYGVDDPARFGGTAAIREFNDRLKRLSNPEDPTLTLPDAVGKPTDPNETYASSVVGGNTVNDPRAIGDIVDRDTVF